MLLPLLLLACNNTKNGADTSDVQSGEGDPDTGSNPDVVDSDGDGIPDSEDCDPDDPNVTLTTYFQDADDDGYGNPDATIGACALPDGYVEDELDCDDNDAAVNPAATEICNSLDDNCDSEVDNDPIDGSTFFPDSDGDGFGDPAVSVIACEQPSGTSLDNTDCDDSDATIYPGSPEFDVPDDGIDPNCDGEDVCNDLNCDGLVDMIIGDAYSETDTYLYLYYNTGSGFSDDNVTRISTALIRDIEVYDINLDGYPDIAVADSTGVQLYYGGPDEYSVLNSDRITVGYAYSLEIDDIDGDGDIDLIMGVNSSVIIYYNSPDGFTTTQYLSGNSSYIQDLKISDFDGDGDKDIISAARYVVLHQNSSSGFSTQYINSSSRSYYQLTMADLDGDKDDEIIYAPSNYSFSYVYGLDSTFSAYGGSLVTYGSGYSAAGDVNGDGWLDMVFSGYSSSQQGLSVFYNQPGFTSAYPDEELSNGAMQQPVIADIDGDGYDDIVTTALSTGGTTPVSEIYFGSKDGVSEDDSTSVQTLGTYHATIGDVDGDGLADLIYSNYGANTTATSDTYIYYGTSSRTWESSPETLETGSVTAAPVLVGSAAW